MTKSKLKLWIQVAAIYVERDRDLDSAPLSRKERV